MIKGKFNRFIKSKRVLFPLALALVFLATYAYQAARMGFYWDDWQVVFLTRLNNPSLFWGYFSYDRPFSAWTYLLTLPILGTSAWRWQLFTLTMRWLATLGLWQTLRSIWPEHESATCWIALLFAVYPAFMQQSISVAYSQHFICYALFTWSLAFMVAGVQKPKHGVWLTALAVLLQLLNLFTMEYFAGLELARPLILWFVLDPQVGEKKKALKQVLIRWAPYLTGMLVYVFWRFFLYAQISDANKPDLLLDVISKPFSAIPKLFQLAVQDLIYGNLLTWFNPLASQEINLLAKISYLSWGVGLVLAFIAWRIVDRSVEPQKDWKKFCWQAAILGSVCFLVGGIPVWATGKQIVTGLWSDRFSLAPMTGAAILLVAMVEIFIRTGWQKVLILALIFGLAVSYQMREVNKYRLNWEIQRNFYWQLFWRTPALKSGTVLLGTSMPFTLVSDYSIAFAINTIYAPDLHEMEVPYWFLSALRYVGTSIPFLEADQPVNYTIRNVQFSGNTSHSLALHSLSPNVCLRILAPADALTPWLSSDQVELARLSNLDQIDIDPNHATPPPVEIFGPEPQHNWCFYYEKADLAGQQKQWNLVISLADEANSAGFNPNNGMELLPFINAYGQVGKWDKAVELTQQASDMTHELEPELCSMWASLKGIPSMNTAGLAALTKVNQLYGCNLE